MIFPHILFRVLKETKGKFKQGVGGERRSVDITEYVRKNKFLLFIIMLGDDSALIVHSSLLES